MTRTICLLLGAIYAAIGFWMLLAPATFYSFAHFAPYNHRFIADIGAFIIPIGCALLWASRNPPRYSALIDVALLASTLHFANHLTDGFAEPLYWQSDIALLVVVIVNAYASGATRRQRLFSYGKC